MPLQVFAKPERDIIRGAYILATSDKYNMAVIDGRPFNGSRVGGKVGVVVRFHEENYTPAQAKALARELIRFAEFAESSK